MLLIPNDDWDPWRAVFPVAVRKGRPVRLRSGQHCCPEITMTWLVPVAWKRSIKSRGMPVSMPRSIPLATAAYGSGRSLLTVSSPLARRS